MKQHPTPNFSNAPQRWIGAILVVAALLSSGCYERVISQRPYPGMAYTGPNAPPVAADYSKSPEFQKHEKGFDPIGDWIVKPIGGVARGIGNAVSGVGKAITGGGQQSPPPTTASSAPAYNSSPGAATAAAPGTPGAAPAKAPPPADPPPASNGGSLFDTAPK